MMQRLPCRQDCLKDALLAASSARVVGRVGQLGRFREARNEAPLANDEAESVRRLAASPGTNERPRRQRKDFGRLPRLGLIVPADLPVALDCRLIG